jgi:hypothetical protein
MISIDILSNTGKAGFVILQEQDIDRFYLWPGDFVLARRFAWIQAPPGSHRFTAPIGQRFREATVGMEDVDVFGEPLPLTHNRIARVSSESRFEHAHRNDEQYREDIRGSHRSNTAIFLRLAIEESRWPVGQNQAELPRPASSPGPKIWMAQT